MSATISHSFFHKACCSAFWDCFICNEYMWENTYRSSLEQALYQEHTASKCCLVHDIMADIWQIYCFIWFNHHMSLDKSCFWLSMFWVASWCIKFLLIHCQETIHSARPPRSAKQITPLIKLFVCNYDGPFVSYLYKHKFSVCIWGASRNANASASLTMYVK